MACLASVQDVFTCMKSGIIDAFTWVYKKTHSVRLGPLLFQTFYQKNVFLGTAVLISGDTLNQQDPASCSADFARTCAASLQEL